MKESGALPIAQMITNASWDDAPQKKISGFLRP